MGQAMLPRERGDYSAIVDRPPLKLPGGARLVFWTIVNLEVWDIADPFGTDAVFYERILKELRERITALAARLRQRNDRERNTSYR